MSKDFGLVYRHQFIGTYSATCDSLIETAKAKNFDPSEHILHILKHIGSADTLQRTEELLP